MQLLWIFSSKSFRMLGPFLLKNAFPKTGFKLTQKTRWKVNCLGFKEVDWRSLKIHTFWTHHTYLPVKTDLENNTFKTSNKLIKIRQLSIYNRFSFSQNGSQDHTKLPSNFMIFNRIIDSVVMNIICTKNDFEPRPSTFATLH